MKTAHVDTFARDRLPPRGQWPEFGFELPELRYPERMNCAAVLLDERVRAGDGERIALRAPDGECSYAQLQAQANRLANLLVR
ncbi:MAG: amino acid adenylation domain-containing protein, partial [Betaproteobacteria bacterium]|nr:amino acid adenylation domain-containing protein [Betaproteobacteria bacterium]